MSRKEVSRRVFDRPKARVVKLNYEVLTEVHRDDAKHMPCIYCWEPMERPSWDHVIPLSKGGPNNRGNLVVVCQECNYEKGDLSLPEYEGFLTAVGHEHGRKVGEFSRWITSGWSDEEKAMYNRVVAMSWSHVKKEITIQREPWPEGVRRALAVSLRKYLRIRYPVLSEKPYTLKDIRRS